MEIQTKPQVFEVNAANFREEVIEGSQERVIVVDFWAPWCGPCRTLGPALEEVVRSLGPMIALAKVNVDENQELAQAFRVQGIPAVKIVQNGQLVDEFTGALPREQIEARLRPLLPDPQDENADLLEQAQQLIEFGDLTRAASAFEHLLAGESENREKALVGLARVRLLQGNFPEVEELVAQVEQGTPEYDQAQALLVQIEFHQRCAEAGGRQACAAKLLASPDDLNLRYQFACCAAAEGDFATALKEWLTVVEADRNYGSGAVKDAMVSVFHLLGRRHEIVADYPQRLYRALY